MNARSPSPSPIAIALVALLAGGGAHFIATGERGSMGSPDTHAAPLLDVMAGHVQSNVVDATSTSWLVPVTPSQPEEAPWLSPVESRSSREAPWLVAALPVPPEEAPWLITVEPAAQEPIGTPTPTTRKAFLPALLHGEEIRVPQP